MIDLHSPSPNKTQDKVDQRRDEINNKKKIPIFKITIDGRIYESIIISTQSFFATYDEMEGLKILEKIEQNSRILIPAIEEEYPYNPIKFQTKEEIDRFIEMFGSQDITIDLLFFKIRDYVSRFIVHHDHIISYISALILFSYLQDKFVTVPYTMFVSDNESGKSSIGDVIEVLGYRCVNMTDPTTANLFRIFGTIESGQCILVLDEAEKIDQDKEMMSILKTGYQYNKKVQRVNLLGKQEHFHTYGLKIMLAERSPNPSIARGVLDRTFVISNFKGKPQLAIKEVKNPINQKQKEIARDVDFLRKSLLMYRLIHFKDDIIPITTGLEGRNDELCKPILQILFNTKCQKGIERCLEILLDEKNNRKAYSLERDVLKVVVDLFMEHNEGTIPFAKIWALLADMTNGRVNPYKTSEMETETHGIIFKTTLSKMLRDRFGAKDPNARNANTRCLVFDVEKTRKALEGYVERPNFNINCKPDLSDSSDSNDTIREDPFTSYFKNTSLQNTENDGNPIGIDSNEKEKREGYRENLDKANTDLSSDTSRYEKDKNRNPIITNGLPPPVTTVTTVTNECESPKEMEYKNSLDDLYRKWAGTDTWACYSCNDSGDKWYMLKHPCKGNQKNTGISR